MRLLKWVAYLLLSVGMIALLLVVVVIPFQWWFLLHRDPTANPIGLVLAFVTLFPFALVTAAVGLTLAVVHRAIARRQKRRERAAAAVDATGVDANGQGR